jgi:regulatory protein YycI of two-component signal transduction system YycFG
MASYASIPYLGLRFKGFIINLVIDHKEYRFSTYNFSKIKLIEKSDNHIILNAKRGQYSLSIKAENKDTIKLPSPKEGIMNQHIKEGLSGYVHILLKKKTHTIIDDIGYSAGIEIMM